MNWSRPRRLLILILYVGINYNIVKNGWVRFTTIPKQQATDDNNRPLTNMSTFEGDYNRDPSHMKIGTIQILPNAICIILWWSVHSLSHRTMRIPTTRRHDAWSSINTTRSTNFFLDFIHLILFNILKNHLPLHRTKPYIKNRRTLVDGTHSTTSSRFIGCVWHLHGNNPPKHNLIS